MGKPLIRIERASCRRSLLVCAGRQLDRARGHLGRFEREDNAAPPMEGAEAGLPRRVVRGRDGRWQAVALGTGGVHSA